MVFTQFFSVRFLPHLCGFTILLHLIICTVLLSNPPVTDAVPLLPGSSGFEHKRYCSNTLSEAIRLICGGRYNSLGRKYPDSVGSGSFRALKRLAPDDGIFYRPMQTGPIHECCRHPCGYQELRRYCAPD